MPRPPKERLDAEAIEQRLRDEAARRVPVAKRWWPGLDEAATLLGRHKSTIWRRVRDKAWLESRGDVDSGDPIEVSPVDLLRRLDAQRQPLPKRTVTRRKVDK